jgi:23S rRNA (guanosine2251-2'-O)-methyltransferase
MTRQVVGIHACREVLKVRPEAVESITLITDFERSADLKIFGDFAKKRGVKLFKKDDAFLKKIASSHQGVCLAVTAAPELEFEEISNDPNEPMVLMALDEVSDPHNVGAILRTAWLTGTRGLLVTDRRAAHLTPAVCKVASGGAEHVPLYISGNLGTDLSYLKEKGFWIFGLAGGANSKSLLQMDLPARVLWILGAEDKGMRSSTRKLCDELVAIPQQDPEASYNASVAAGIALFESLRQSAKAVLNS